MKFTALLLCALCALLLTQSALATHICNAKSTSTNVRSGPSAKNYPAIDKLSNGTEVEILDRVNNAAGYDYLKIRFVHSKTGKQAIGYVYSGAFSGSCSTAISRPENGSHPGDRHKERSSIQADSLTLANVFLSIGLGIALALGITIFNRYVNESNTGKTAPLALVSNLLFLVGIGVLWTVELDLSIKNAILVLTAFVANILVNLAIHFHMKSVLQQQMQNGVFSRARRRDGYYEHKDYKGNAFTSRFGCIVIGQKQDRGLLNALSQWLFFKDGWSDEQRNALYLHEKGHNIFAIPIIFMETLIFYWFCTNLFVLDVRAFLLVPALIAAVTLTAWLDELLADTIAGSAGFTLRNTIGTGASIWSYVVGGIGAYSHPPLFLRYLAFMRTYWMIALGIIAVWLWLS